MDVHTFSHIHTHSHLLVQSHSQFSFSALTFLRARFVVSRLVRNAAVRVREFVRFQLVFAVRNAAGSDVRSRPFVRSYMH